MTKNKTSKTTRRPRSSGVSNVRHQRLVDKVRVLQARVLLLESSFGKREEE